MAAGLIADMMLLSQTPASCDRSISATAATIGLTRTFLPEWCVAIRSCSCRHDIAASNRRPILRSCVLGARS